MEIVHGRCGVDVEFALCICSRRSHMAASRSSSNMSMPSRHEQYFATSEHAVMSVFPSRMEMCSPGRSRWVVLPAVTSTLPSTSVTDASALRL